MSRRSSEPSRPPPDSRAWVGPALLVIVTLLVYANSFRGPFIFDDLFSIVENPTIRRLWSWETLNPPNVGGITVSGRPVLNLSLALNHAISGLEVWSYHALNLLIHLLAGLTLFGLVRRTLEIVGRGLRTPPPTETRRDQAIPPYSQHADILALVIAGIWLLHPLQTESVTYIIQRAESLMGLFFLLTIYCFVRASPPMVGGVLYPDSAAALQSGRKAPPTNSGSPLWFILSFLCCLLGVGTKEVAVLAPVIVFLYDRTFVSGSFRAAWQRHRYRHLALAATWLPLAWLVAGTGGNRGGTMGLQAGLSLTGYWLTQFEAVTRYLWLALWPHPLIFDYGKIPAPSLGEVLPWILPVLLLVPATLWALWRRPVVGFLGAWFFGILAPTSLVPGVQQMIVEHRMYLPLAAVLTLALGWVAPRLGRRGLLAVGAGLALAAGAATWHRNSLYQDEARLWADTIAKRPENARTHNHLGRHHYLQGRWEEAIACFRESLRLDSSLAQPHFNLGLALIRAGRPAEAVAPLETAVRILPDYFSARLNLGIALTKIGRAEEALPHFAVAARFDPWPAEIHFQWGIALAGLGRWPEAAAHYAECLRLNPGYAEAESNWGTALLAMQAVPEAIAHFEAALRLQPDLPQVRFNLGQAHRALGHREEAIANFTEAVRLDPVHATARLNLGIALAETGRLAEALAQLETAVQLQPMNPAMHYNLGVALALAGRAAEAEVHFALADRYRVLEPTR